MPEKKHSAVKNWLQQSGSVSTGSVIPTLDWKSVPEELQTYEDSGMSEMDVIRQLQRKQERRKRYTWLKSDPIFQTAPYRCRGNEGRCHRRLLLGIRNAGHIRFAISTLESLGWRWHKQRKEFYCEEHRHEMQQLDTLRGTDGSCRTVSVSLRPSGDFGYAWYATYSDSMHPGDVSRQCENTPSIC